MHRAASRTFSQENLMKRVEVEGGSSIWLLQAWTSSNNVHAIIQPVLNVLSRFHAAPSAMQQ